MKDRLLAAALDHGLRGADRKRTGVDDPLHGVGRAEFAWKSAAKVECVMNSFFLSLATCTTRPTAETRNVDDQVDLIDVVPAPRDAATDVRLELVVTDEWGLLMRFEHLAAEIVDRHLR